MNFTGTQSILTRPIYRVPSTQPMNFINTVSFIPSFSSLFRTVSVMFFAAILFNLIFVGRLYTVWKREFASRLPRSDKKSRSHKLPPYPKNVLTRTGMYQRIKRFISHGNDIIERSERVKGQFQQPSESPTSRAKELDMDHQRVDFTDFVWAYYFIVPNAVWLWVSGIVCLKVRELLRRVVCRRLGVRDPSVSVDPRRLVGQLMLEGTQLVYFNGKFRKDGKEVATFMWPDFPMVGANGKFKTAKMSRGKCLEKAELDGETLAARDTLILVWFHTIFANHVKIHAYANWASNPYDYSASAFQRRMSVTTVMYNYFGHTVFPYLIGFWKKIGLFSDFIEITDVIEKGISNGMPNSGGIDELMPYSELARFMVPLRKHFHRVFAEHKDQFPHIDAQSFFVGTIGHSLDHTLMGWNLPDALYLDTDRCDPRFRKMAELGRVVRVGFVDDLPYLMFNKNYHNSPDKFYQQVYQGAAKLNKRLADHMDCCIIK